MRNPEQGPPIESREHEPTPVATLYFVRHGDTQYKEEFTDPQVENDLTDKGKEQIRATAEQIQAELNPEDKVYMMVSPRTRAKSSAEIISENLQQKGHEVVPLEGGKLSLSNIKILDTEGRDIYKKKDDKDQYLTDMAAVLERLKQESDYYIKSRLGSLENPVTGDVVEYRNKVKTFLRRLIEIARQRGGSDEKLVLVTHGEWLDTLLEIYFDQKIEKVEDSAGKGEFITLEILPGTLKFKYNDREVSIDA
jgi:broad specificity phosphatase PhoE